MAEGPIFAVETVILVGVIIALILLIRMVLKAKTLRSMQSQLSIFLTLWAVSEIPRYMDTIGLLDLSSIRIYGLAVHTVSMVLFELFIVYRFLMFVRR